MLILLSLFSSKLQDTRETMMIVYLACMLILTVLVISQEQDSQTFSNSSLTDKLGKLTEFTDNQDPEKLKELEEKLGQAKAKECLEVMKKGGFSGNGVNNTNSKKKIKNNKKKKIDDDEESEGSEGLFGALEQITNLGDFGAMLKNTPLTFICLIRYHMID